MERVSLSAAGLLAGVDGVDYRSPLDALLEAGLAPIERFLALTLELELWRGLGLILISGGLVFFALLRIVRAMRGWMGEPARKSISGALGKSASRGLGIGFATTAVVQSSSVTTSLLVPLAGAGLVSLEQAFPIVLGANIGTTVTALMAALAASGPNAGAGIAIAIVHTLYNLAGTAIFLPFRTTRRLPLGCARWMAERATASPAQAFAYVTAIFYGGPALFAGLHELLLRK
jgi:sodium-dependent phosphate cotransporter